MRYVQFSYRKVIDNQSKNQWDQKLHKLTHKEYFMQSQFFDPKGLYPKFQDLSREFPRAAAMHSLVSTAAHPLIMQLEGIMPDVGDRAGSRFIPFEFFRFEIIQSHSSDLANHVIAIEFFSREILLLEHFGHIVLISKDPLPDENLSYNSCLIDLYQNNLNIYSYRKLKEDDHTNTGSNFTSRSKNKNFG